MLWNVVDRKPNDGYAPYGRVWLLLGKPFALIIEYDDESLLQRNLEGIASSDHRMLRLRAATVYRTTEIVGSIMAG
jgi:hypothetical protein